MIYKENEIEEMAPWLVFIATLAGGFLRIYLLDNKGLWLDETFSIWMANHGVADMLQWIIKIDQHPPLYYLLLHYWITLFGDTAYAVRMLSVLFGIAAIPVIYLIGKRISGTLMGVSAAVLLAFSPFHIFYAQETRMYTLLTLNAAVAIYALVRLLADPCAARPIGNQFREYMHTWRTAGPVEPDPLDNFSYEDKTARQTGWRGWIYRHRWLPIQAVATDLAWIVFIVFSAAMLLTHNTAVFFILATNIFVIGLMLYQRKTRSATPPAFQAPSIGNWVKAQIGIFVLWSPWFIPFIQQSIRVDQEFWIPTPTWEMVIQTLRAFLNPSARGQFGDIVAFILVVFVGVGLFHLRRRRSIFVFLATLFAIPFLGELIVSLRRPIFYDRTLIWITVPLFLGVAAGIAQFRYQLLIFAALVVIGSNYVFSATDYFRWVQKEDWSRPTGYVAINVKDDDVVLFNSAMMQVAFDYYFKDYENKFFKTAEQHGVPDMFDSRIPEPRMTSSDIPRLNTLVSEHKRVWLIYSHDSYTDPTGLVPQTIEKQMKLIEKRDYYGVQVRLYGNP